MGALRPGEGASAEGVRRSPRRNSVPGRPPRGSGPLSRQRDRSEPSGRLARRLGEEAARPQGIGAQGPRPPLPGASSNVQKPLVLPGRSPTFRDNVLIFLFRNIHKHQFQEQVNPSPRHISHVGTAARSPHTVSFLRCPSSGGHPWQGRGGRDWACPRGPPVKPQQIARNRLRS